MSAAAIRIDDLAFRWRRKGPLCVTLAHLAVDAGKSLFLHGPSGVGKSTLLNLIGGVLLPERGGVELLGQPLGKLSAAGRDAFRADHLGFVFQQFNLIPYLSVLDNVLLPCRFSARRAARAGDPQAEARRLLGELDLAASLATVPAAELSVGQQQRVAAARALIGRPEIIIADEPTSALDASRQSAFIDLLLREAKAAGSTVVFVSHDERLAAHFDEKLALTAGAAQ
ncbi:ABC transporter ATP-binding protein [Azonexus sp.]|uniref:ABC transporter ATP-binding protein n=1 Tax=Azonexus sp. TaxID=1872668 RepID=UPI0027B9251D|nr:ABC transporter ATP-binding protein [Azonexus sp.]